MSSHLKYRCLFAPLFQQTWLHFSKPIPCLNLSVPYLSLSLALSHIHTHTQPYFSFFLLHNFWCSLISFACIGCMWVFGPQRLSFHYPCPWGSRCWLQNVQGAALLILVVWPQSHSITSPTPHLIAPRSFLYIYIYIYIRSCPAVWINMCSAKPQNIVPRGHHHFLSPELPRCVQQQGCCPVCWCLHP